MGTCGQQARDLGTTHCTWALMYGKPHSRPTSRLPAINEICAQCQVQECR